MTRLIYKEKELFNFTTCEMNKESIKYFNDSMKDVKDTLRIEYFESVTHPGIIDTAIEVANLGLNSIKIEYENGLSITMQELISLLIISNKFSGEMGEEILMRGYFDNEFIKCKERIKNKDIIESINYAKEALCSISINSELARRYKQCIMLKGLFIDDKEVYMTLVSYKVYGTELKKAKNDRLNTIIEEYLKYCNNVRLIVLNGISKINSFKRY